MALESTGPHGEDTADTAPNNGLAKRRAARREGSRTRSDERYAQIRDAATKVFFERGYASTSLEDIANAVGVNRASLYYYVGDKSELLIDILGNPLFQMTERLMAIRELPLPATDRLRLAVQRHMQTLAENYPNLFIFFAENLHVMTIGTERDIVDNSRRYGEVFTSLIRDGQEAGELDRDVDARIAMLGIIGMCNWTYRWFRAEGKSSLTDIGDQFARLAVNGLAIGPDSMAASSSPLPEQSLNGR